MPPKKRKEETKAPSGSKEVGKQKAPHAPPSSPKAKTPPLPSKKTQENKPNNVANQSTRKKDLPSSGKAKGNVVKKKPKQEEKNASEEQETLSTFSNLADWEMRAVLPSDLVELLQASSPTSTAPESSDENRPNSDRTKKRKKKKGMERKSNISFPAAGGAPAFASKPNDLHDQEQFSSGSQPRPATYKNAPDKGSSYTPQLSNPLLVPPQALDSRDDGPRLTDVDDREAKSPSKPKGKSKLAETPKKGVSNKGVARTRITNNAGGKFFAAPSVGDAKLIGAAEVAKAADGKSKVAAAEMTTGGQMNVSTGQHQAGGGGGQYDYDYYDSRGPEEQREACGKCVLMILVLAVVGFLLFSKLGGPPDLWGTCSTSGSRICIKDLGTAWMIGSIVLHFATIGCPPPNPNNI